MTDLYPSRERAWNNFTIFNFIDAMRQISKQALLIQKLLDFPLL